MRLISILTVIVVAIVGVVVYMFYWDPELDMEPAPNEAALEVNDQELAALEGARIFFGHVSVGQNILSGVEQIYDTKGAGQPHVVEISPGVDPSLDEAGGVFAHAVIGPNGEPETKLDNFEATLDAGLGKDIDIAMVKFCYVDINKDTDVSALFDRYQDTMSRLQQAYPDLRLIHATVPLTVEEPGIKGYAKRLLGRDDNPAREQYNAKMRETYDDDSLFDIAAIEAERPDGSKAPNLYAGYSDDGEHLNDTGSALVAADLFRLVADGD